MKNTEVKLSKEQFKQLADANSEFLEKSIINLQKLGESKDLDFKIFWQKSNEIHKIFKGITPIEKVKREKLWKLFLNAKLMVKQRQEKERVIKQTLKERTVKEILLFLKDVKELIIKENKEVSEIELLIFFVERLKSLIKGDFESLPDTPDKAFLAVRLKKLKFDENIREKILKTFREGKKSLQKIAEKKYDEIKETITKVANEKSKMSKSELNRWLKSINSEITSPFLLIQQKNKLKRSIASLFDQINLEKKEEEFDALNELKENLSKNKEESSQRTRSGKMKEIKLLLEEIEQTFLKQS